MGGAGDFMSRVGVASTGNYDKQWHAISQRKPFEESQRHSPRVIVFQNQPLELQSLYKRLDNMINQISEMNEKLDHIVSAMGAENDDAVALRDISYEDAKKEIRQYFKDNHGKSLDIENIEEDLKIDPFVAAKILSELAQEGKVKSV